MPDDLPRPLPPDRQNPLFADQRDPVADHSAIRRAHVVLVRERYRDIRNLWRTLHGGRVDRGQCERET